MGFTPAAVVEAPSLPGIDVESRPRHLSPSSASLYRQCPRKWKHRYVDGLADPPGPAALAGTFAHRVLELLLLEPEPARTVERARQLARRVWPETENDPDFKALGLDEDGSRHFRWRGWQAVEGLWTIEDPCTVRVEATEQDVRVEIDGVPFRGIIDRVDATEAGDFVSDYKSGRAPSERFRDERVTQVLLYAAALAELTGQRPVRARLLYLGQKIVDVEVDDHNLGPAVAELQDTWASVLSDCDRGTFDAQPGPLCGWCPFIGFCPEGQAEVRTRHDEGRIRADAPALAVLADAS